MNKARDEQIVVQTDRVCGELSVEICDENVLGDHDIQLPRDDRRKVACERVYFHTA